MAENGRSAEMVGAAERVREPQFNVQKASKYQRTTVLDNLWPTGNGMGELDRQRVMMGVTKSRLGTSDSTFEKNRWLDISRSSDLYKTFG